MEELIASMRTAADALEEVNRLAHAPKLDDILRAVGYGPVSVYRCYRVGDILMVARNLDDLRTREPGIEEMTVTEIALNERIPFLGRGITGSILDAIALRLLGGETPPFRLAVIAERAR